MKNTKQQRDTRLVELVETHNLCLSINRLRETDAFGDDKWRRALYHALGMAQVGTLVTEQIRIALKLP